MKLFKLILLVFVNFANCELILSESFNEDPFINKYKMHCFLMKMNEELNKDLKIKVNDCNLDELFFKMIHSSFDTLEKEFSIKLCLEDHKKIIMNCDSKNSKEKEFLRLYFVRILQLHCSHL